MVELDDRLKHSILRHRKEIDSYQFVPIYADLNSDFDMIRTGYFTDIMLSIGIDPAKYIGRLPDYYMYKSQATKYTIPGQITDISSWAFARCENLEEISIPKTVAYIWSSAFRGCESLKHVELPDHLLVLGDHAFDGCISLRDINIPKSLASLGELVFQDCVELRSLDLGNCFISTLPEKVCRGCVNLETISLPQTIKVIEYQALADCRNLKKIIFTGTIAQWRGINRIEDWRPNDFVQIHCTDGTLTLDDA